MTTTMLWIWMAALLLLAVASSDGSILLATPTVEEQEEAGSPEAVFQPETATAAAADQNDSATPQDKAGDETVCAWGTACHSQKQHQQQQQRDLNEDNVDAPVEPQEQALLRESTTTTTGTTKNTSTSGITPVYPEPPPSSNKQQQGHIPFVQKSSLNKDRDNNNNNNHNPPQAHFVPPEGFAIKARVYTDPHDKLAHFTDDGSNDATGRRIKLPYWECGATGSTTSPLPVKHAYFRHALASSNAHVWSGAEYGPHPQLVVALKPMEISLNSGESKQLNAGDVVLLEDVVQGGHKLKSLSNEPDMTYLLLTLPQHYHHVGKDRISLQSSVCSTTKSAQNNPCDNLQLPPWQPREGQTSSGARRIFRAARRKHDHALSWDTLIDDDKRLEPWKGDRLRRWLLGALGVSVSTLVADFLGKVAPLWLAVGIGGTCFVAGGTWGFVKGGEYVCTEIDMWRERRKLYSDYHSRASSPEEEDSGEREAESDTSRPMTKNDRQDNAHADEDTATMSS